MHNGFEFSSRQEEQMRRMISNEGTFALVPSAVSDFAQNLRVRYEIEDEASFH